jgi:anthranilate phosphoribosyltransferase
MEEDILKQMGLSDEELREFLRKINVFFNDTLNDKEREAFLLGLKSKGEAAHELKGVTSERLEKFLRGHEPTIVPFNICKKY